ncbi:MAG TPA: hypothetical protein VFU21_18960 [Kofleriaceae bacterium]|nr:hypothetical protein [Kofleriaceae bacterium]
MAKRTELEAAQTSLAEAIVGLRAARERMSGHLALQPRADRAVRAAEALASDLADTLRALAQGDDDVPPGAPG